MQPASAWTMTPAQRSPMVIPRPLSEDEQRGVRASGKEHITLSTRLLRLGELYCNSRPSNKGNQCCDQALFFLDQLIGQLIRVIPFSGRKVGGQQVSASGDGFAKCIRRTLLPDALNQAAHNRVPGTGRHPLIYCPIREHLHPSFQQRHHDEHSRPFACPVQTMLIKGLLRTPPDFRRHPLVGHEETDPPGGRADPISESISEEGTEQDPGCGMSAPPPQS